MLFFFQFKILRGVLKISNIYMIDAIRIAKQSIDFEDEKL
jgi:hypothetical protein